MNDEYLKFAKELAKEAGDIMKRYFREESTLPNWKNPNDPVTKADQAINSLVIEKIKSKYPNHGILGEEESFNSKNENLWLVDPVDGTIPFILGQPISAFLLAFTKEGRPEIAVAYNPWIDIMHWAVKGKGAFCNGKELKISEPQTKFVELILWNTAPLKNQLSGIHEKLEKAGLSPQNFAGGNSRYGVAENRLYGVIFAGKDPWDSVVLDLVVTEAGGVATDLNGKTLDFRGQIYGTVAGSRKTHRELMEMVSNENHRN
jgi:myo-inositol-1(or 4)-monophosphatase